MLYVTYEATEDLEPGRLARIDEGRGWATIIVDKRAPLEAVIRQLNIETSQFLARADWYQLWGDDIASRHNPAARLRLEYIFLPGAPAPGVCIREVKGELHFYVDPAQTTEQFAAAACQAVQGLLDGGCWFQQYAGEIIDHSPEPMQV
ncbi:hypothetical protein [Streptomyces sp. NPDC014793]|uniref:hypothetical protein n=1 Tax=Streptomyces sp. NPDC014793 TaxID=3364914 RepID=UPI0036FF0EBD